MTIKSAVYRLYNYMKLKSGGVILSDFPDIKYRIYFKKSKSSSVKIGKRFTFFSGGNLNPLSPNGKGAIFAENDAVIQIGDQVGMSSVTLWAKSGIQIGDRVTLGANVKIIDSDCHSLNWNDRWTEKDSLNCKTSPVVIENDVLIGANAIILKGVRIGARSVIGAGSIVTHDIPADCIAAGNPAKVIKKFN